MEEKNDSLQSTQKKNVFPLPSVELLTPSNASAEKEYLVKISSLLMHSLAELGIAGELVKSTPGPVVTRFEVRFANCEQVESFLDKRNDLEKALESTSIRIIRSSEENCSVGLEVPNKTREIVNFRELASTEEFQAARNPLTLILGKDSAGEPVYADLASMPHMLIAGAAGTGKSIFLNCLLASFFYRCQPSELKLLLIDFKRSEMSVYDDEPHLIHPVVNELNDAKHALEWVTSEMDARYEAMACVGVRNIANFNERLKSFGQNKPDKLADLEPLPYIVIVIDELADLMMADRNYVEKRIVRLAQLARACGIHLILSTEKPSNNVVTDKIKANFPCRISFQLAGIADSHTILGCAGAEKLLGQGDMLYRYLGQLKRLHGAFLSEDEVASIVAHWKSLTEPTYNVNFVQ